MTHLHKRVRERVHGLFGRFLSGTPIWDLDWDICCVLDGCRVDTFRAYDDGAGSYRSVGATSKSWLRRTFEGWDTSNVAYVSANPFAADLDASQFGYCHVEPVEQTAYGVETVEPETLRDIGVSVWRDREDLGIDKLVIHFMQPHVPFRSRPEWFDEFAGTETWGSHRAYAVADGEIGREEWLAAYADNLSWVLEDAIEPMGELVDAGIGLTADHGNAVGEWGLYGHPKGVAVPAVRRVPWATMAGRRVSDGYEHHVPTRERLSSDERKEQLAALGYR